MALFNIILIKLFIELIKNYILVTLL